ncbi:MAG: Type secretion system protein VirB9 [Rickettsiaceae bacterium]|jgi:type IV secretion system protein VirB9|nr:Type secretion system protein VirB9 [Rickettsiaceae bacterium]
MTIARITKACLVLVVSNILIITSSRAMPQETAQQNENISNRAKIKKDLIEDNLPITVDNRIKTYVYNPNEIYLLVLHFGFQSHIEFAKGEEIETLSLGDTYAWKLTPLGNRLFIKPMEKNIRTNMTIITNKRTYQFDLVAKELEEEDDERDLVYLVRFFYPKKK